MNVNTLLLLIALMGFANSNALNNESDRMNNNQEASVQLYPDPPVCPICSVNDD
ncbi:hypothetical protein [Aliikangiella sp. G2MR2-5]|uniref:hypothetical protein n=1 Tax=Aliikangiella sp. G2MR2-5 TaxID=2788943 RepID=UPI0018A94B14|nr:hypothetical protein [Aliikangiella sp. G2MR2-5]